jgi:hypothetical protein
VEGPVAEQVGQMLLCSALDPRIGLAARLAVRARCQGQYNSGQESRLQLDSLLRRAMPAEEDEAGRLLECLHRLGSLSVKRWTVGKDVSRCSASHRARTRIA